jgi:hypothetical protein
MSLVTIGLDFGTTAIKCVVRSAQGTRHVVKAPNGDLRWRAILAKVREGAERDRLLVFNECDQEQWRLSALHESNLKLSLLALPESPAAVSLSERWSCQHYALPTLLLAFALHHAMAQTRQLFPGSLIHVFMGAPVANLSTEGPHARFERALYAALLLSERWRERVPVQATDAVSQAERAWADASTLPPQAERVTWVVPEAFAACEGAVSAGGGVALPTGRLCVIDMGGGTTDVAWIMCRPDGYAPLRMASFDVAGEWIEAPLIHAASRASQRRVTRQEFWSARDAEPSVDGGLKGNGWALQAGTVKECLAVSIKEWLEKFRQHLLKVDEGCLKSPNTRLVFVGGATQWTRLRSHVIQCLEPLHDSLEVLPVGQFGLEVQSEHSPMAVAVGLSNGWRSNFQDRWVDPYPPVDGSPVCTGPRECACRGLMTYCDRCGGAGILPSANEQDRFGHAIDLVARHPFAARCPFCHLDFPKEFIFGHLNEVHPERAFAAGSRPRAGNVVRPVTIDVSKIREALASGGATQLSSEEQLILTELQWLWLVSMQSGAQCQAWAQRFLVWSARMPAAIPWLHLPRAIAFAVSRAPTDVARELNAAKEAGYDYDSQRLRRIFDLEHPSRFTEAWTCLMK